MKPAVRILVVFAIMAVFGWCVTRAAEPVVPSPEMTGPHVLHQLTGQVMKFSDAGALTKFVLKADFNQTAIAGPRKTTTSQSCTVEIDFVRDADQRVSVPSKVNEFGKVLAVRHYTYGEIARALVAIADKECAKANPGPLETEVADEKPEIPIIRRTVRAPLESKSAPVATNK